MQNGKPLGPHFQSMLSWADQDGWMKHIDRTALEACGLAVQSVTQPTWERCKSDVRMRGHQRSNGGVHGDIEFNSEVYAYASIEKLAQRVVTLAASFAEADPETDIWSLLLEADA